MNALAGRLPADAHGAQVGEVLLNGRERQKNFRRMTSYVMQVRRSPVTSIHECHMSGVSSACSSRCNLVDCVIISHLRQRRPLRHCGRHAAGQRAPCRSLRTPSLRLSAALQSPHNGVNPQTCTYHHRDADARRTTCCCTA